MFTTAAASASRPPARIAAAMRSVPLAQSAGVISHAPPNASTARAIRSSSVSTTTRSRPRACDARAYTCSIIGRPAITSSGLPGRRVEA